MLRAGVGLLGMALVTLVATVGPQNGCRDAKVSLTHIDYWPYRDMRNTVVLDPTRGFLRDVDSSAVPITGVERPLAGVDLTPEQRDAFAAHFTIPTAADDSSIARGERKFRRTCVPCHGPTLAGDGPVAALFMPPPDLLAQPTRDRKDGYLYSYIRHGGVVMPSYGAQVTAREAYDLIHYLRYLQKTRPR